MTAAADPSWSDFFAQRRRIHARYRSVWDVPILRKRARLILPLARPGAHVLDVGGGEREWEARLRARHPDIVYRCLEIDPRRPGDVPNLADAGGPFDLALFLEVIEHMTLAEGFAALAGIHAALAPGGRLVASTPNVFHPSRFLEDATHKTPYSYECLGGACLQAGFTVESIHRSYNASVVERPLRLALLPLHKALGVDFAKSIFVVARKAGP